MPNPADPRISCSEGVFSQVYPLECPLLPVEVMVLNFPGWQEAVPIHEQGGVGPLGVSSVPYLPSMLKTLSSSATKTKANQPNQTKRHDLIRP